MLWSPRSSANIKIWLSHQNVPPEVCQKVKKDNILSLVTALKVIIYFLIDYKILFLFFFKSYIRDGFLLLENATYQDPLSVSVAILHQFNILPEMYQVGYTKLFFRTGQVLYIFDIRFVINIPLGVIMVRLF